MTGITQYTEDQYGTNNTLRSLAQSEIIQPQPFSPGNFNRGYQDRHSSSLHGVTRNGSSFTTENFPNALKGKKGNFFVIF